MLPGSVVDRWAPCDHILLINLCSKTLRLRASVSEKWRRTYTVWTTKARKGVQETIEILSVNTILFTYRRCSIWPPPTLIHVMYCMIMSCRIVGKIPGVSQLILSATCIRATRSCVSTRVSYTRVFMYPQKWKSNGVRSGDRRAHTIGPPCPNHLLPKASFKWRHNKILWHEYN